MNLWDRIQQITRLEELRAFLEQWLLTQVLVWSSLGQIGAILAASVGAWLLARPLGHLTARLEDRSKRWERNLWLAAKALQPLGFPVALLALLWLAQAIARGLDWPYGLISTTISLLTAWIVIRFTTALIRERVWAQAIALLAWSIAALDILGLLGPTMDLLDRIGFTLGESRLSLLTVVQALILLAALLWLAMVASRFAEQRINQASQLTPSIQVLVGKLLRVSLLAAAFVITLNSVGVDLTALAVFTGAVGVGVGFGLQKVVSNLISGLILLLDRSIKPGDVIEVGDTFGWVASLGARYVALSTREGKEWLIPNEDLITQRVINWSFSDKRLRLPMRFGISYYSDVRKAMELAVEAAIEVPRVLRSPEPVCRLTGFGDSAVEFELRIWIEDPRAGVINVRSDIYLALWDKFRANDIHIPYPQRDLHLIEGSRLEVTLRREASGENNINDNS